MYLFLSVQICAYVFIFLAVSAYTFYIILKIDFCQYSILVTMSKLNIWEEDTWIFFL